MPALSDEQYDALRADIAENGIVVPVTVDQHGRVLDGHNRRAIAAELGIACPIWTRHVGDDEEAADLAVTLNCARRHLTQEQKRELIRAELHRRFEDSDRAVAKRVGCSPTTVGAVRAEMRAEAEESVRRAREELEKIRDRLAAQAMLMHRGIDRSQTHSWQTVGDVMERIMWGEWCEFGDDGGWEREGIDPFTQVFVPIFGEFFDALRAYECSDHCRACTPEQRRWRDEHPGQVYRHSEPPEVSNLDSTESVSADV